MLLCNFSSVGPMRRKCGISVMLGSEELELTLLLASETWWCSIDPRATGERERLDLCSPPGTNTFISITADLGWHAATWPECKTRPKAESSAGQLDSLNFSQTWNIAVAKRRRRSATDFSWEKHLPGRHEGWNFQNTGQRRGHRRVHMILWSCKWNLFWSVLPFK